MSKQPEGGAVGTAQTQSYTYGLHLPIAFAVGWLVWQDLRGARLMSAATGLESTFWIWVCLLASSFVAIMVASPTTAFSYYRHTGLTYVQDRLGYAKSGGSDVASWAAFVAAVAAALGFAWLPAGWLGWARPFALLVAAGVVGYVLARLGSFVVLRALYAPRRVRQTYGRGLTCQQLVLPGVRCHRGAFRESEFCRWHRILQGFRADLVNKPKIPPAFMFQAGVGSALALMVGRMAFGEDGFALIPALLSCWLLGTALKLFADAVLARDYPLAQFAIWSQLLAAGMFVEIVAGGAAAWAIGHDADGARALVAQTTAHEWAQKYVPAVLAVVAGLTASMSLTMFVRRVLFLHYRYFDVFVWPIGLYLASGAVLPLFRGTPEQIEESNTGFWAPIGSYWWALLAWFLAFNLCELVNVTMRRKLLTEAGFRESVWPSFPICSSIPVAAVFLIRYVMVWTGLSGLAWFFGLVLLFSGIACAVVTLLVLRRHPGWKGDEGELGPVTVSVGARTFLSDVEIQRALAEHANQFLRDKRSQSFHANTLGIAFFIITRDAPRATQVLLPTEAGGRP